MRGVPFAGVWNLADRLATGERNLAPSSPLARLRRICRAFPEAHEVEAWGAPTFRVRNKLFAMFASPSNHHGQGRPAVWCKATPVNQALMVEADPRRYFVPPYVGPSGWVGIWLDRRVSWRQVEEVLEDSWRLTAPKRLIAVQNPTARKARPR